METTTKTESWRERIKRETKERKEMFANFTVKRGVMHTPGSKSRHKQRGVVMDHAKKCQRIYQQKGQHAVFEYARKHPGIPWTYCDTCQIESPEYVGACLVCGESVESMPFICLQYDKTEGRADCGCRIENRDTVRFFPCDTHKAAPELRQALTEMCRIERDQDPEYRNVHDSQRKQYEKLIRKAGGKI